MAAAHMLLGIRHSRSLGLPCDEMGTLMDEKKELLYSFFNADQICDFLLSIGMKPLVELSFMPTASATSGKTVFHEGANVTPPKDCDQ
jgi:xylan 1,4-beta-xylosidase